MEVDRVICIILAIFLGGFDVHKFYAGKMILGLLHLLLCWTGIPHIATAISAILTLLRSAGENGNVTV